MSSHIALQLDLRDTQTSHTCHFVPLPFSISALMSLGLDFTYRRSMRHVLRRRHPVLQRLLLYTPSRKVRATNTLQNRS